MTGLPQENLPESFECAGFSFSDTLRGLTGAIRYFSGLQPLEEAQIQHIPVGVREPLERFTYTLLILCRDCGAQRIDALLGNVRRCAQRCQPAGPPLDVDDDMARDAVHESAKIGNGIRVPGCHCCDGAAHGLLRNLFGERWISQRAQCDQVRSLGVGPPVRYGLLIACLERGLGRVCHDLRLTATKGQPTGFVGGANICSVEPPRKAHQRKS